MAPLSADPSVPELRRSLTLYRKLLSQIRKPHSEEEILHLVVDVLHEQFPGHRVSISDVLPEGIIQIRYSRTAEGLPSISGQRFDISAASELLASFMRGETRVTRDIRSDPYFAALVPRLSIFSGTVSRLDVPFEQEEGKVRLLSLTHGEPQDWTEFSVELLREVGELLGLMVREAIAKDRLERSETVFTQFADNVELVFWMSDTRKNQMLYVSPAYERVWGRSRRSLYENPRSFLDAVHPEDRPRVVQAVEQQGKADYEQIYRVVQPGGEVRWVKDRGFRVRDEKGEVVRIAGIAEDISALHETEERLEATQAKIVSNAKFAALGEMASGIAHEINNPLAVIHGLAVQLQEVTRREFDHPPPMMMDSLASIEKMANRIAGIVKGLRTFSRQTAGDPLQPADLNAIIQETLAMCEAKLRAAGVEITLRLPEPKLDLRCRSSEISQVLLNLINNAFDAVWEQKKRAISLCADRVPGKLRVFVEDNGPGIDRALRGRIFQPFFTTKEVGRGTGLGLSISKGIIESHGGRLFLDETAEKTRFVIELPSEEG